MVAIIFNYDGDISEVEAAFNVQTIRVPEMIEGTFMIPLHNADDFDVMDEFMDARGKIEVIAGWDEKGKGYPAKKLKNKYNQVKYLKYLEDKWTYDEEGNKLTKIKKEAWQVNKIAGWADREL